jgi:hypothetical protein
MNKYIPALGFWMGTFSSKSETQPNLNLKFWNLKIGRRKNKRKKGKRLTLPAHGTKSGQPTYTRVLAAHYTTRAVRLSLPHHGADNRAPMDSLSFAPSSAFHWFAGPTCLWAAPRAQGRSLTCGPPTIVDLPTRADFVAALRNKLRRDPPL